VIVGCDACQLQVVKVVMDIDAELFDKGAVSSELISRGVEDGLLFDSNEDLHKSLFASLDSFSIPLSPRPAMRDVNNKLDTDVTR